MDKKHYLIYGHGGSYNHGGEAITRCTIALLRKIYPDCKITLSTHFPEQDLEFGIEVDEMITRNITGTTNEEVYQATLDTITSNTTVIQVGGDNYCYNNWQRYAQIHKRAKQCGGKSIFWSCSIDEDKIDDEMLQVLQEHDLILARECITFETLKAKGLQNVRKVSDIAFWLEPEPVDFSLDNYIAINVSPLVCKKNPLFVSAIQQVIDFILKETEFNIALVPHVVVSVDNDFDVLSKFYIAEPNRVLLVSDKLPAKQYKYIISKAKCCIAARTHAAIAAYSSCVPVLAVSYSTKSRGIAKDLDCLEHVIDILDADIEKTFLEKFRIFLEEETALREKLQAEMDDYKEQFSSEEIFSYLRG